MRIAGFAMLCAIICAAGGCRTLSGMEADFKTSSKGYNEMLRWRDIDKACATWVDPPLQRECEERAAAVRDVKVVDYRIKGSAIHKERGEAEATVEIDYYLLPSARVKTLEDRQKWRYQEEGADAGWRLISLPPDFR